MKKGAIFDMDGVLFDTEQMYQDMWRQIAAERGCDLAAEFGRLVSGTSGEKMYALVKEYYHVEDGREIAAECLSRVHEKQKSFVPEKPGIHEILEFFQRSRVKMAVASSSLPENIRNNLRLTGIDRYFNVVVSGSEVKRGKPSPDIFLYAAERLGLPASDCYVFEDSLSGVRAGAAAGCATVMIPDLVMPTDEIRACCAGIYSDLSAVQRDIEAGRLL